MTDDVTSIRAAMVGRYRRLDELGFMPGTAGNLSVRVGTAMLITPSSVPAAELEPGMLATMALADGEGSFEGPLAPSSEWRLHRDILRARSDIGSVVHTHAPHATALAMTRRPIPACHYMVAMLGGDDVRCAGYARFGTQALSDLAVEALRDRKGCLLANHGMIALGATLEDAVRMAEELETLARQYWLTLAIGGPVLLDAQQMTEARAGFASYGRRAPAPPGAKPRARGRRRPGDGA